MALTDWIRTTFPPIDVASGIDPVDPILGTGSFRMIDFQNSIMNMFSMLYTPGLTRGRIRMLIRLENSSIGDDSYRVGMYVMANSFDLTTPDSDGPTFYTLALKYESATSTHTIALEYHDAGIEDAPLVIFESSTFTLTRGLHIVPLQLEWKLEDEFGPGIHFTVRGSTTPSTLTNFSNLTELTEFVHNDPATTLLSSSSEGLYFEGMGGSLPSGLDAMIDEVSIFSISRS